MIGREACKVEFSHNGHTLDPPDILLGAEHHLRGKKYQDARNCWKKWHYKFAGRPAAQSDGPADPARKKFLASRTLFLRTAFWNWWEMVGDLYLWKNGTPL